MRVRFFGAAGEVTGSCHLVESEGRKILLDCGMIQGGREEHERNAEPFGFDAGSLDAVVLSHAHIDHVGRMPLLARRGYDGPIYTQRATAALARIMLEDSARLAQADVAHVNRRRQREGRPLVKPLYEAADVEQVLSQLKVVEYDAWEEILPGLRLRLSDAGHILGAAIIELHADEAEGTRKLVFSGDIGPKGTPILRDPTAVREADLVLMESTYGDRLHRTRGDTLKELGEIFEQVHQSNGNLLIPAFAVGRTQELLYWFAQNFDAWGLARFKIVLDSPMASKVTQLYDRHHELFDEQAKAVWKGHYLPFRLPNLRMTDSIEESRAMNEVGGGLIIIAGSGMCNGGRIKHHLKHHLWRSNAHVMFPGYQANGTLGRLLVDGAERVRIFGDEVEVKAMRHTIGGLSAHADQAGLLEWYGHFQTQPRVCLVHGEDDARGVLASKLESQFGATVTLAQPGMALEV